MKEQPSPNSIELVTGKPTFPFENVKLSPARRARRGLRDSDPVTSVPITVAGIPGYIVLDADLDQSTCMLPIERPLGKTPNKTFPLGLRAVFDVRSMEEVRTLEHFELHFSFPDEIYTYVLEFSFSDNWKVVEKYMQEGNSYPVDAVSLFRDNQMACALSLPYDTNRLAYTKAELVELT